MAQAFAIMHGKNNVEAFSAGSKPSGKINEKAIQAMKELGYDLTTHMSKSLDDIPHEQYEYVITMGCGDACPFIPAKHHIDWEILDPREMNSKEFRKIRDMIEKKVIDLLDRM